ncbi:MAG: hypothetical protein UU22_C0005G0021 [Parcubacteria group bacterium GW2011_GWA2_40_8]|nr:MAG: hypothetical protein UU22_C0005G0021 [Parcubacteria group bacterium GW2011_GWA2_40_8]
MKKLEGQNYGSEVSLGATDAESKIRTILEVRRDSAPDIEAIEPLSVEEMARLEGVEVSALEDKIRERVSLFAEEMESANSYHEDNYAQLMEELYSLYLLSQNNRDIPDDISWIENLRSFDQFCDYFCPDATPHAKAFIGHNVQRFIENVVHPSRDLQVYGRTLDVWGNGNRIYDQEGDWVLLPERFETMSGYRFAEKKIIEEIRSLVGGNYVSSDYTHAAGSAALNGIAREQAILSAQEAVKAGIKPKTGEFVSYVHQESGKPSTGILNSVYVDRGGPKYGYNIVKWFGEYFVTFGINKERQEEYLRSTDVRYGGYFDNEPGKELSHDTLLNEGTLIGHRVPLSAVDVVYAWKTNEPQVQEWIKLNCPQAKFVSLEAAQILKDHTAVIGKMAQQEGISQEEVWEGLLK